MPSTREKRREIEELLPFWLNGTLSDDERDAVAAAVDSDEELRREVAFLEDIQSAVRSRTIERSPGELGFARLRRAIAATRPAAARPARSRFHYGLLAASAAFAMLGGVALYMSQDPEPVYIQASDGSAGPALTVEFRPDATVAQISRLLLEHDLVILDGPSARQFYRIGAPGENDLQAAAAELRAMEDIVAFVAVTK